MTDGRVSFSANEQGPKWDNAQKAYASTAAPIVLGCVGHGLYAAHIAPRLLAYAECLALAGNDHKAIVPALEAFSTSALRSVPAGAKSDFDVVLGTRYGAYDFRVDVLHATRKETRAEHLAIPERSGIVCALGSGSEFMHDRLAKWQETRASDTSRGIYSAFCDALLYQNPPSGSSTKGRSKDPYSEGPPQLVGLYRKWNGMHFGTIWRRRLYFAGIRIETLPDSIECRNDLFERCDSVTLRRLEKAKGHIDEVTASKRAKKI